VVVGRRGRIEVELGRATEKNSETDENANQPNREAVGKPMPKNGNVDR